VRARLVVLATGASLPTPTLVVAALGAVLALLGIVGALAWWRGWTPRWADAWRHALSEAAYRARGTWSDFEDWLHSG
jgi:hypothetical protein